MASQTSPVTTERNIPLRAVPGYFASKPGIQVATQVPATASDEDLQFIQQLGVEWVMTGLERDEDHSYDTYTAAARALRVLRPAHLPPGQPLATTWRRSPQPPRPRRQDRRLPEPYPHPGPGGHPLRHLRPHGQRHLTTGRGTMRGGVEARAFDLSQATVGYWNKKSSTARSTHAASTEDELGQHSYFIQQVVPVAEEAGVYIGIHPDDRRCTRWAACRCIFGTFEGYKRALEIADSAHIGMCPWAAGWRAARAWART